jgi:DNA ligase D-like protein (predicted ligase)
LHEIKHDGNRTLLVVEGKRARAFTRRGLDWSKEYAPVVAAGEKLRCRSAILDGEVIVQGEDGRSDFNALRSAIYTEPHRLLFFAFDLLHLNGKNLRDRPLTDRKAELTALLDTTSLYARIQLSEPIDGDGAKVFGAADAMGLEGIVSKRKASRYKSGRSPAWLKTKCMTESEFVVVGMEPNPGGAPFALLAREENGELIYAGSAFVTLPAKARDKFWNMAEKLKVDRPAVRPLKMGKRKATFVAPKLRVRARHMRAEGMLRHASLTELLR